MCFAAGELISATFPHTTPKALAMNPQAPAWLLVALSAGALVYVGALHLLPRTEQERKRYSLVALAGGVGVALIVVASKR
ncbi:MAG: hypothetical protein U5L05_14250 [Rubrivivax sp.]|nr:hypothetical protein [Rubrivivax sp.]